MSDMPGDTARLRSVGHVVAEAAGGLLVADTVSRRIRRFGRDGSVMATIGAPGIGPGQMQTVSAVAVSADTVFVWDSGLWRISAFDTTGVLILTRRAEPRAEMPVAVARNGDGTWLLLESKASASPGENAGAKRAAVRVVRWSPSANAWTPVADFPAAGGSSETAAASPNALWAVRNEGEFWHASGESYAITKYSANGESLASIVLAIDAQPRELRVSREGELWVRVDAGSDSVEWHAFDTFGEMRYRVHLPRSVTLHAIVGDTVIASAQEAAGGSFYVVRFTVRR
jgi:hypothetical protein